MNRRQDVIDAARSFLGTPFHHQGRVPGVGLDCIGLVDCALAKAGVSFARAPVDYEPVSDGTTILSELERRCERIERVQVRPGDLYAFAWVPGCAQHMAIATGHCSMIHIWRGSNEVSEHQLTPSWESRIHSCWRVRGID